MSYTNINTNTSKISVGYDGASTTLFLRKEGEKLGLLNYERDSDEIHRFGGGRCFYKSLSGLTGEGYLRSCGDLIPVGAYRVDLPHFSGATFKPLNEEWDISFPFAPHRELTSEEINHSPVVLRHHTENVVAFEPFDLSELERRLSAFLSGEHDQEVLEDGNYSRFRDYFCRSSQYDATLNRTFTRLQFVDGFGVARAIYSPWCFSHPVEAFSIPWDEGDSIMRRVFGLFHDGANTEDSRVFSVGWLGENRVALACYTEDPLQFPYDNPEAFRCKGWNLLPKKQVGDGIAVAYNARKGEKIRIAAWRLCGTSSSDTFQQEGIVRDVYPAEFWFDREHLLNEIRKNLIQEKEE